MKDRLREINRSLRILDEAHFQGRITRDDYRQRRRHLLGTLCDGGGITARNTVSDRTVPRGHIRNASAHSGNDADWMHQSWWKRLFSKQR